MLAAGKPLCAFAEMQAQPNSLVGESVKINAPFLSGTVSDGN